MKSKFIFLSFGFALTAFIYACAPSGGFAPGYACPNIPTITQLGASGANVSGNVVVCDSSGNIYVTGTTDKSLGGTQIGTLGSQDFFLAKFSSTGSFQWVKQLGSAGATLITWGLVADANGNIYVGGGTSAYLGGTQFGTHGVNDAFVAKFSSSGSMQWVKQFGAAGNNIEINSMVQDKAGNFYFTGDTDGSLGGIQYGAHGSFDIVLIKFNGNGDFQFANQFGVAANTVIGYWITFDSQNNPTLAGYTNTSVGGIQYGAHGSLDLLVTKFNSSGVFQWANQLGVAGQQTQGYYLYQDTAGNIFVTGNTTGVLAGGAMTGTHGASDVVLAKFNSSGVFQWVSQLGIGAGSSSSGVSILQDISSNIIIAGYTDGTALTTQYGSRGSQDLLVAKFTSSGAFQWEKQLGQTLKSSAGYWVTTDASGTLFMTGNTTGALGGTQIGTHGSQDMLIFKVNSDGNL